MRALVLSEKRWLRYVVFFNLYVMQGLPAGLSGTVLVNYLTAEKVSPDRIGAFAAAAALPWGFQFIWGPILDRFQGSRFGRRRPWVLLAQLAAFLASLGLLTVTDPVAQIATLTLAFFTHSLFASVQDAAVDAMAISTIPDDERGRITGLMRAGFIAGIGGGAVVFSLVIRQAGFTAAVTGLCASLFTLSLVTLIIRERPGDALFPWSPRETTPQTDKVSPRLFHIFAQAFAGIFSWTSLRFFGAVIVGYLGANVFYRAYSFHLIRELGWADTDLSVFSGTLGTIIPLGLVLGGGVLADRLGQARLLIVVLSGVGGFLLVFSLLAPRWGQPGVASAGLVVWSTFDPLISVAGMPVLMAICRRGVEGSQFTAYMALVNLTDVAGQYLTGLALTRISAPQIGLVCGLGVVVAAMSLAIMTSRKSLLKIR